MTNRRFIDMVRNYAREARRKNRSYAPQVLALLDMRAKALHEEIDNPIDYEAQVSKAHDLAVREYGAWDASFSVPE